MPLLVIAASFFLPTVRTCTVIESPLEVAADGLVWVVPWYLGALLLASISAVAAVKLRPPSRAGWVIGTTAVIACALVDVAGLLVGLATFLESHDDRLLLGLALVVLVASLVLGVSSLRGARARAGWPAWTRLLLGYWAFVLPLLVLIGLEALDGSRPGPHDLGPGAYTVAAATALLGLVVGRAAASDLSR